MAIRLQHALDGREPPDLALIPIDLFILPYILEGGDSDTLGAFRRFKNNTYDTEHESRWVLFSDEREAGRARHWLAQRGLRPD